MRKIKMRYAPEQCGSVTGPLVCDVCSVTSSASSVRAFEYAPSTLIIPVVRPGGSAHPALHPALDSPGAAMPSFVDAADAAGAAQGSSALVLYLCTYLRPYLYFIFLVLVHV